MSSGTGRVASPDLTSTSAAHSAQRRPKVFRRRSTRRGSRTFACIQPGQMIWITLPLSPHRSLGSAGVSMLGSGSSRTVMAPRVSGRGVIVTLRVRSWESVVDARLPASAVNDLGERPAIRAEDRRQRPVGGIAQGEQVGAQVILGNAENPAARV